MANIVASIFSGHIFDIKTMLGMDAIIPTIGSNTVSPIK
jgi:proline racemase